MRPNPEFVRRSLDAHSAIGLVVGAVMYLVCLTGTLATLAETFERWEQPDIPEFTTVTPAAIENAMRQFRARADEPPESLWVVFPTTELPRMHVTSGREERFTDAAGNLHAPPREGWTHMLRELHLSLHLPHNIGLIVVSSVGAMLVALIVSGLFAHPRLFKDAFRFRLGGSRRLEQADIHNRLSVWGLPFHLMIAVTGAFYGLVGLLVFSASTAWYDGDSQALFNEIYGEDPVLEAAVTPLDPANALAQLQAHHPEVGPLYIVAHDLDSPSQFMEIAAMVPGRLAYSEIFRFDAQGNYLGSQGLTSGPAGRQFLYSLYRIHFGYFGGQATRITWLVLGLALTVVTVSGINIWLSRRAREDWLGRAWCGMVWGAPLALTVSATAALFSSVPALASFLVIMLLSILLSIRQRNVSGTRAQLQGAGALWLALLAATHLSQYSPADFGTYLLYVNLALLAVATVLAVLAYRSQALAKAAHGLINAA